MACITTTEGRRDAARDVGMEKVASTGDFSGVPVGAADKNRLQFLARDTGGSAATLLARLHVALAPELPHPALRGRLANTEAPSEEDVSALSTLVRFDQPLPQFDRMRFCHAEVRSNPDPRRNRDQLSWAVGLAQPVRDFRCTRVTIGV